MKNYENKLLKVMIEDNKFLKENIKNISRMVFQNGTLKFIFQLITEYHSKYGKTPNYDVIEYLVDDNIPKSFDDEGNEKFNPMKRSILDQLKYQIQELELDEGETLFLKDELNKRIQKDMLKKMVNEAEKGNTDNLYDGLKEVEKLQKYNGGFDYEIKNLWDYDEEVVRDVIPTGIEIIDSNGGVARGEIGIMLASTGVGKSVFLSFLANNFMLSNLKVLHIVFEGATNDYIRLHRAKLGNPSNDLLKRGKTIPNLKVIKMYSGKTSITDIQDFMDALKNDEGFVPDVICLDYLDLIAPTKVKKEHWMSEINTSNELEEFCWRNNIVLWTAVQTNRSGLNNEIPNLSQIAGSVSKAQKASMILGVARSPLQVDGNTADVAIIKNRYGKTEVSHNCMWNPTTMEIKVNPSEDILL